VLEVQKSAKPWYPTERPLLTPASWFQYKAAALKAATPRLAPASGSTPAIDKTLSALAAGDCWAGKKSYAEAHAVAEVDRNDPTVKIRALAAKSVTLLEQLKVAFSGYRLLAAAPTGKADQPHKDMGDIVKTYLALISLNLSSAKTDGPPS
jgi:hypothetical protein